MKPSVNQAKNQLNTQLTAVQPTAIHKSALNAIDSLMLFTGIAPAIDTVLTKHLKLFREQNVPENDAKSSLLRHLFLYFQKHSGSNTCFLTPFSVAMAHTVIDNWVNKH